MISYTHRDHPGLAGKIADALDQRPGTVCWYDQRTSPSDVWSDDVYRAVRLCRVAIVLVSECALTSGWVQHEVSQFRGRLAADEQREDAFTLLRVHLDGITFEQANTAFGDHLDLGRFADACCNFDAGADDETIVAAVIEQFAALPAVTASRAALRERGSIGRRADQYALELLPTAVPELSKSLMEMCSHAAGVIDAVDANRLRAEVAFELCRARHPVPGLKPLRAVVGAPSRQMLVDLNLASLFDDVVTQELCPDSTQAEAARPGATVALAAPDSTLARIAACASVTANDRDWSDVVVVHSELQEGGLADAEFGNGLLDVLADTVLAEPGSPSPKRRELAKGIVNTAALGEVTYLVVTLSSNTPELATCHETIRAAVGPRPIVLYVDSNGDPTKLAEKLGVAYLGPPGTVDPYLAMLRERSGEAQNALYLLALRA